MYYFTNSSYSIFSLHCLPRCLQYLKLILYTRWFPHVIFTYVHWKILFPPSLSLPKSIFCNIQVMKRLMAKIKWKILLFDFSSMWHRVSLTLYRRVGHWIGWMVEGKLSSVKRETVIEKGFNARSCIGGTYRLTRGWPP